MPVQLVPRGSAPAATPLRVRIGEDASAITRLLTVMEQLINVSFVAAGPHDACLRIGEPPYLQRLQPGEPAATLSCAEAAMGADDRRMERVRVQFADRADVPWPFRGRQVYSTIPANCAPLSPREDEVVLAGTPAGPLWVMRTAEGRSHFRSALPLLEIPEGGSFSQVFSGSTFLANLPLLHLLAQFNSTGVGIERALRATFMFDDPNLHWPTYGYIHYADLFTTAEKENFHVSFATIPLDSWFTHEKTAAQFRAHPNRLSLLVHGNDHTRHELARQTSEQGCRALLLQALRRIEQMERRARVAVDRVMVPPHGACSEAMLAALPRAGFEGACISAGSLSFHNPDADWVQSLGFRPAELIRGCPVLPRWPLVGIEESELLVAAYLGRPLILRGHHGDLRDGLDILVSHARFINGLGNVLWTHNAALLHSSYRLKVCGTTAYLQPFARQVRVLLPAELTTLVIEPSPGMACRHYCVSGLGPTELRARPDEAIHLGGRPCACIVVTRVPTAPDTASAPAHRLRASSVLRRLLTEARDRLMPLTT